MGKRWKDEPVVPERLMSITMARWDNIVKLTYDMLTAKCIPCVIDMRHGKVKIVKAKTAKVKDLQNAGKMYQGFWSFDCNFRNI